MNDEIKKMLDLDPKKIYNPSDKNDIPSLGYSAKEVAAIIRGFKTLYRQRNRLIPQREGSSISDDMEYFEDSDLELLKSMKGETSKRKEPSGAW